MTFGRCVYAASFRRRHRYPSSPAAPAPSRARVEGSGTGPYASAAEFTPSFESRVVMTKLAPSPYNWDLTSVLHLFHLVFSGFS